MASLNGSVHEFYPSADNKSTATVSKSQKGFTIRACKLPISKAAPIEEMSERLGISPPEMIFGDNMVSITHDATGWEVEFNAFDGLDKVEKTEKNMLKVSYSKEWTASREKATEGIKEVVKPFDWSYTTDYKGTVKGKQFSADTEPLPIELLKRQDPIIFYEEVVLYESELDDNGISVLSCRVRVMPDRMLLLCRFFLRVDDVIFRIHDTRVYVDFHRAKVIREYTAREERFESVKHRLRMSGRLPDDTITAMRDPNQIQPLLPIVAQTLESVSLN